MKVILDEEGIAVRFLNGTILFIKQVEGVNGQMHVIDVAGETPPALSDTEFDQLIVALGTYRGRM